MFLILAFRFTNIVLKGLLLDLHFDVLLLLGGQILVGDVTRLALFLEIARIFERSCSFEVGFECTIHVWEFALHTGVPMVLNGVIRSSFKNFGDLSPLIINDSVHEEQNPLFLLAPGNLLNHGVQVVVPAFTALLSNTIREVLCNQCPLLRAIAFNKLKNSPVLFSSPWSFDRIKF